MRPPRLPRTLAFAALASILSLTAIASLWRARRPEALTNPFVAHQVPIAERETFRGVVDERLPAGSYVYLRVRPEAGEGGAVWVTSLAATTPAHAAVVEVHVLGRAEQLVSKRLSRTFAPLLFAIVRAGSASAGSQKEMP